MFNAIPSFRTLFTAFILLLISALSCDTLFAASSRQKGQCAIPITVTKGGNHGYTIRVLALKNGNSMLVDIESIARALRLGFRKNPDGIVLEESFGKTPSLCTISTGNNFVRVTSRNPDIAGRIIQLSSAPVERESRLYLPINQGCRLLSLWINRPVEYNASSDRIHAALQQERAGEFSGTIGILKSDEQRTTGGGENEAGKTVITGIDVEKRANGAIISFTATGPQAQASLLKPDIEGAAYFSMAKVSCDITALTKTYSTGMIRSITPQLFSGSGLQFTIMLDTRSYTINSLDFQYNKKSNSYDIYILSDADVEAIHRKEKEQQIAQVLSRDVEKWKLNTVVLDAGHGGKDPGAIGGSGTREKDVALNIVHDLGSFIEKRWPDVRVIYTRKDDTFIPLHERGKIANRNGGKLFVSVHCNASVNRTARGSEVYILGAHKNKAALDVAMLENSVIRNEEDYQREYKSFTDEYLIMSSMAQNAFAKQSTTLAQDIIKPVDRKQGTNSRGVRQAGFMVLWTPSMPSALVEVGYLSNAHEEQILRDRQEQTKIAYAIFKGMQLYRKNYEASTMALVNK